MTFGEKLQKLRAREGISQDRLAELLDVSRQAVSKWERDETMPEAEKLIRISDYFHVTTDYLLKDAPEEPPPPKSAAQEALWLLGLIPLAFGVWGLLRMLPGLLMLLSMGREAVGALWLYVPHLLGYGVLAAVGVALLLHGRRNRNK